MTPAQKRALEAVRDGKCFRRYTASGNTLHGPKGVGSAALWALARARLIYDRRGDPASETLLMLTDNGRLALRDQN